MNGMLILAIALSAVVSYILGSINSAIIVGKLIKHQDIRTLGSKNAGLTNTLRCFGKGCALITLIGDLAKGVIAVFISKGICTLMDVSLAGDEKLQFIGYVAGIAAILGHVFPLYYGFRGGKGVLVGVSVFLVIDWRAFLIMILIFSVVLAISKYVSLGSIIASGCCPVVTFLLQIIRFPERPMWYILLNTGMAAAMGLWVIWMHRTNIERLKNGCENRFSFNSKSGKTAEK